MTLRRGSILTALTVGAAILLPTTASAAEQLIQQPEPEQVSHFSVFRTPPEGLPPLQASLIEKELETPAGMVGSLAGTGLNPALAQKLDAHGGRPLWVVPGSGVLVLVNAVHRGVGVSAPPTPTKNAIRHGIGLGKVGLVPDGVIDVRVTKLVTVPALVDHMYTIASALRLHSHERFWQYPTLIHGAQAATVKAD